MKKLKTIVLRKSMNNTINQRIKTKESTSLKSIFGDIFTSLKDIFGETKSDKNEEIVNQKIEQIYEIQSKLGGTDNIAILEQGIRANHIASEKMKKSKTITNITAKVDTSKIEKTIQEESVNQENILDK